MNWMDLCQSDKGKHCAARKKVYLRRKDMRVCDSDGLRDLDQSCGVRWRSLRLPMGMVVFICRRMDFSDSLDATSRASSDLCGIQSVIHRYAVKSDLTYGAFGSYFVADPCVLRTITILQLTPSPSRARDDVVHCRNAQL